MDLFINSVKVADDTISKYLKDNNVTVYEYDKLEQIINNDYAKREGGLKVIMDCVKCNHGLCDIFDNHPNFTVHDKQDIICHMKSMKNEV